MKRSKWKNIFIQPKILNKLNDTKTLSHLTEMSRNTSIIPKFIGHEFKVYSGKNFRKILVNKDMLGHKFGEFCPTREKFEFKKKKKKK